MPGKPLRITVRDYRLWTPPDIPCTERNTNYRERQWDLPVEQCALVLIDVWDLHYNKSHEERSARITRERIVPLLRSCRKVGVTIVHAPSPPVAKHYEAWTRYAGDRELGYAPAEPKPEPAWPPAEFRQRSGPYACFAKPKEPRREEWDKIVHRRRMIAEVGPEEGDFVIATGEQLQRLLAHRKILHLFFVGFATNMCVLYRDYGTRAMAERGYNVILVRDCTTAIEASDTIDSLALTKAACLEIEMLVGCTTTSDEIVRACDATRE